MAARLRDERLLPLAGPPSGDVFAILDDALRVTWTSAALDRAVGPAAADLVGQSLLDAVHPGDVAGLATALVGADSSASPEAGAGLLLLRLADADGVWHYLEAGVSDLREHADVGAVVLHCRDMTDRHAREQALQNVAYTDAMTGLPNRFACSRPCAAVSSPGDASGTLLMIELAASPRRATTSDEIGWSSPRSAAACGARSARRTSWPAWAGARSPSSPPAMPRTPTGWPTAARRSSSGPIPTTPAGLIELTAGVGLVQIEDGLCVDTLLSRGDLAVRAAHAAGRGSAARYTPALGEAGRPPRPPARRPPGRPGQGRAVPALRADREPAGPADHRDGGDAASAPPSISARFAEFLSIAERAGLLGELLRWTLTEATAAVVRLPSTPEALRVSSRPPTSRPARSCPTCSAPWTARAWRRSVWSSRSARPR